MTCQIGILVSTKISLLNIRQTIDDTAAIVEEARKKGPGSIIIQDA